MPRREVDLVQASVAVYSRLEAYYVVTAARSTVGLWLEVGPADVVAAGADSGGVLADAVARALMLNAVVVPHPRQDEWSTWRREALAPLMRQARVRSWKAFVSSARLVSVDRRQGEYGVIPHRRDGRRADLFEGMPEHRLVLRLDSAEDLGLALTTAFALCQ